MENAAAVVVQEEDTLATGDNSDQTRTEPQDAAHEENNDSAALDESTLDAASAACSPQTSEARAADELSAALVEAFAVGGEGLMLKSLTATYEPSRRSDHWVKLKRDYCEGLHDTLDLVVIGAWYGQGRKVKWYSPFLLAVWDPRSERLQSMCRCMSGFSDAFYQAATERLGKTVIPGPKPYYETDEAPSVWFEPREVWEIRGADLTLSPVRTGVGLQKEGVIF